MSEEKTQQQKKVLVISYHFAPSGSTGGIRALKFVKYFRDFGWEPVVLSSKFGFDFDTPQDADLCRQIPEGVKVFRTWSFEILNWIWLRSQQKRKKSTSASSPTRQDAESTPEHSGSLMLSVKKVIHAILAWPDIYIGWVPFAVVRGLWVMWKEKIDLIYVTVPPPCSAHAGYILSLMTGTKMVLDLRDPMTGNPKFLRFLEKRVVRHAAAVVCTSGEIYDIYRERYLHILPEKFYIVHNGFDQDDYCAPEKGDSKTSAKLTFIHAGCLYSQDGVSDFLKAFAELSNENSVFADNARVLFIAGRPEGEDFARLTAKGSVKYRERIPRAECMLLVQDAHVILTFLPERFALAGCIPSKIFDAMLFQKSVISVMKDGAAQKIIRESGVGYTFCPGDLEGLKKAILKCFSAFQQGSLGSLVNEAKIQRFNRHQLTQRLIEIFNKVR